MQSVKNVKRIQHDSQTVL